MRRQVVFLVLLSLSGLLFLPQVAFNQSDEAVCTPLIAAAFTQSTQCSGLESNTGCFSGSASTNPAAEAGQSWSLYPFQTITGAALDTTLNQFGIVLFNTQAGLPTGSSGVIGVLLGEGTLTNAVAEDTALRPTSPLPVTAFVGANVRSRPDTNASVLGSVPTGTTLQADATSADRNWLRVMFEGQGGWISKTVVNVEGDVNNLPAIGETALSPAQSICLQTADSSPTCGAPPPLLLLQTPDEKPVTMTVNGAPIDIAGTVVLRTTAAGEMQVMVLSGTAKLDVALVLPLGFTASMPVAGCSPAGSWHGSRPLSNDELALLEPLAQFPAPLLHAAIRIPTQGEIQAVARQYGVVYGPATGQLDCSRFHTLGPDGLLMGMNTFYWEAVPNATSYHVNIYNDQGTFIGTYDSGGSNTNLSINMAAPGFGSGFEFYWQVEALLNGQVACATQRTYIQRESGSVPVGQQQPAPGPTGSGAPGGQPTATTGPAPTATITPGP
ncbi:MAG: SH3 domain-containing protein [Anaerolineaceae bacterium]|nr:SH3 domain-containing protein [Anaerolineaceae bacterium]